MRGPIRSSLKSCRSRSSTADRSPPGWVSAWREGSEGGWSLPLVRSAGMRPRTPFGEIIRASVGPAGITPPVRPEVPTELTYQ